MLKEQQIRLSKANTQRNIKEQFYTPKLNKNNSQQTQSIDPIQFSKLQNSPQQEQSFQSFDDTIFVQTFQKNNSAVAFLQDRITLQVQNKQIDLINRVQQKDGEYDFFNQMDRQYDDEFDNQCQNNQFQSDRNHNQSDCNNRKQNESAYQMQNLVSQFDVSCLIQKFEQQQKQPYNQMQSLMCQQQLSPIQIQYHQKLNKIFNLKIQAQQQNRSYIAQKLQNRNQMKQILNQYKLQQIILWQQNSIKDVNNQNFQEQNKQILNNIIIQTQLHIIIQKQLQFQNNTNSQESFKKQTNNSNINYQQQIVSNNNNQSQSQICCYDSNNFLIQQSNLGEYLFQSQLQFTPSNKSQILKQKQYILNNSKQIIENNDQFENRSQNRYVQKTVKAQNQLAIEIQTRLIVQVQKGSLVKQNEGVQVIRQLSRQKDLKAQKQIQKQIVNSLSLKITQLKEYCNTLSYAIQEQMFCFMQLMSQLKQQLTSFLLFWIKNIKFKLQNQLQQELALIRQDYQSQIKLQQNSYRKKVKHEQNNQNQFNDSSILLANIRKNCEDDQYQQILADLSLQNHSLCEQLNIQHQHNQILFQQNRKLKDKCKQFQKIRQKQQQLLDNNQKLTQYIFQLEEQLSCVKYQLQIFLKQKLPRQHQKNQKASKQKMNDREIERLSNQNQIYSKQINYIKTLNRELQFKINHFQTSGKQKQKLINSNFSHQQHIQSQNKAKNSQSQNIAKNSQSQNIAKNSQIKELNFKLKQYEVRSCQNQKKLQESILQYFALKQRYLKNQHQLNLRKQKVQQIQVLKRNIQVLQQKCLKQSQKMQQIQQLLKYKQTQYQNLAKQLMQIKKQYQELFFQKYFSQKIQQNHKNKRQCEQQSFQQKPFIKKNSVHSISADSFINNAQIYQNPSVLKAPLIYKKQQSDRQYDKSLKKTNQKYFYASNASVNSKYSHNDEIDFISRNKANEKETLVLNAQESVNLILQNIRLKKSQVSISSSQKNLPQLLIPFEPLRQSLINPKSPSSNNKQIQQIKNQKMKQISQKLQRLRSDIRTQIKQLKP